MQYKKLGKSELQISEIGFGCMSLNTDSSDNINLIRKAVDNGINYFDTADLYNQGGNESLLGKAISGMRNKIIIATKVGNKWNADGTWEWTPRKEYILKAVDESLKRLNTDYIDLYQLHGGTLEDPIDEVIEAFEELIIQGKIRYYGVSSIRPKVIECFVERAKIVSVMLQYNMVDRRAENGILDLLKKNNIGVLARGVVAKGMLAGKQADDYLSFPKAKIEEFIKYIKSEYSSISYAAIQFVLDNSAVTAAVLGASTIDQLENIIQYKKTIENNVNRENLKSIIPDTFY